MNTDNNTAIPREIMDKIEARFGKGYNQSTQKAKGAAIFGYQLRQQEVDELRSLWQNAEKHVTQTTAQLKAANETIEELRKEHFTRHDIIEIIDELLQCGDILMDAATNENTEVCGEYCLEIVEDYFAKRGKVLTHTTIVEQSRQDNKNFFESLQSALIHEKKMRSKEADSYNKRIQELEAELRKYRAMA